MEEMLPKAIGIKSEMISHKHKFIFVQIPKTGCTSVANALAEYCINTSRLKNHFTYSEYLNNKTKREKVNKDYFSFAFVRNPFDRLVSQFKYSGMAVWGKVGPTNLDFTFQHYVKYIVAQNLRFSNHRYNSKLKKTGDEDWSQLQFVGDDVGFIGKFETLQEDFNTICDKIGIPQKQVPHLNKTKHKHYTEYYDDETRQIVADKYAKDIKYFGYKFGE